VFAAAAAAAVVAAAASKAVAAAAAFPLPGLSFYAPFPCRLISACLPTVFSLSNPIFYQLHSGSDLFPAGFESRLPASPLVFVDFAVLHTGRTLAGVVTATNSTWSIAVIMVANPQKINITVTEYQDTNNLHSTAVLVSPMQIYRPKCHPKPSYEDFM